MSTIKPVNESITDFVDVELEISFMAGVLKNEFIARHVTEDFESKFLSNEKIKIIYDVNLKFFRENGVLLDFESFVRLKVIKKRELVLFEALWNKFLKVKEANLVRTIAAKEALKNNWKGRKVEHGAKNIIRNLAEAVDGDSKGVDRALNIVESLSNETKVPNRPVSITDPISGLTEYKIMSARVKQDPNLLRTIPTGIRGVDQCYVGAKKGDFCMVTARTGGGKSIFLLQCAIHCCINYGNVILVTIEMSEKEYLSRIYSYFSLINVGKIINYQLTKDELLHMEKKLQPFRSCGNKLHIIHMPEGATIQRIKNCIEEVQSEMSVDLVIVDYLNIIRNEKGQIDYSWENQCTLATELKLKVAKSYGIPVWTGQQVTGDNEVAFSRHIVDQLDCGVQFKVNKKEWELNREIRVSFNKHRSFTPKSFNLQTYFECSRIQRPSPDLIKATNNLFKKRIIKC